MTYDPNNYYNWFDQMNQGQDQMQPAQPQPQPGSNWQQLFGGSPYSNQGMNTTMPVGQPDVYGAGQLGNPAGGYGQGAGANWYNQPTGGIYKDDFGNQQPNTPISYMDRNSPYGNAALFPVDNSGGGTATAGMMQQQQAPGALPRPATGATAMGTGAPSQQSPQERQIQSLLEDPNGPYANRKPGDYGPIGAPDYVLNPQNDAQWQQRYYWFQQHPEAFTTGYTQPRDLQASQYDFSKAGSVPYTAFLNNAYADTNAKQGFHELSGVLSPEQLAAAQKTFGWSDAVSGLNTDANLVYQTMYKMAAADPTSDYNVVKVDQPNGTVAYALEKRPQSQQAQQAAGYYAPGTRPVASGGGGGGGYARTSGYTNYGSAPKTPAALPTPTGTTTIQPGPGLDTRMVGGSVNMGHPVEGQIVNYNGQMVQFRNGKWTPLSYNGGGQHVSPV